MGRLTISLLLEFPNQAALLEKKHVGYGAKPVQTRRLLSIRFGFAAHGSTDHFHVQVWCGKTMTFLDMKWVVAQIQDDTIP